MVSEQHAKIAARHLTRNAYLYVRQSSMRQVFENTESTERQYALQQRALELGWTLVLSAIEPVSSSWSPRSAWAKRASLWVWKCHGWRVTPPTGIGCWRSVR